MKIEQERQIYKPIKITLETVKEADDFISLIDKIDRKRCHGSQPPSISPDEYALVIKISNFSQTQLV